MPWKQRKQILQINTTIKNPSWQEADQCTGYLQSMTKDMSSNLTSGKVEALNLGPPPPKPLCHAACSKNLPRHFWNRSRRVTKLQNYKKRHYNIGFRMPENTFPRTAISNIFKLRMPPEPLLNPVSATAFEKQCVLTNHLIMVFLMVFLNILAGYKNNYYNICLSY